MLRLAVVENEKQMMEIICDYINSIDDIFGEIELSRCNNAEELLNKLGNNEKFEIILSDIELDSMQGIEFGKVLREKYPEIYLVFLTAHPEYAAQSYVLDAYQYILKSEMEERLPEILKKLVTKLTEDREKYIMIKTRFEAHKIYHKDIICIKKVKGEKYTTFCTTHGEYAERISLEQLLKEINSDKFIMADRGHVVNYDHIVSVKENHIYLSNRQAVTISRAKISAVKEQIFKCWERMQ